MILVRKIQSTKFFFPYFLYLINLFYLFKQSIYDLFFYEKIYISTSIEEFYKKIFILYYSTNKIKNRIEDLKNFC